MKLFSKIKKLFRSSKYTKKIYIDNSGFVNKGDQLMIMSVVEQIRKFEPKAQILVRKNVFEQNPTYCIQNKLYPLELTNSGIKRSKLYSWMVNFLLRDEWINTPRQVDLILDCRGYHLADWRITNQEYVDYLAQYYSKFKKKGRKLVFLPQAFGPFNNSYSQQAVELAYKQADLIYARDRVSYNSLQSICPSTNKIGIAPDFTCLTSKETNQSIILPEKQYIIIIPNSKMIEQANEYETDNYINFLVGVSKYLDNKGEHVYLLNHEGQKDKELLDIINKSLNNRLPILTNISGMEIKSIIVGAKLLISGRFHGVVSGLTQGVPTLVTSWSHKYGELLREHGCEGNMLNVNDIFSSLKTIQEALEQPEKYSSKEGCEDAIENRVKQMWKEISTFITK